MPAEMAAWRGLTKSCEKGEEKQGGKRKDIHHLDTAFQKAKR